MPCPERQPLGLPRNCSEEEKPRRRKFPRARRIEFFGRIGKYAIDRPAQWLHEHAPKGEAYLNSRWKRIFDLASVIPIAIIGTPIISAEAIYVSLHDRTWPFYALPCAGKDGEIYGRWKIRTMIPDARHLPGYEIPMLVKSDNDPRVIHSDLRKGSVDELPQILNVIRGEMSVVGVVGRPQEEIDYLEGIKKWEPDLKGLTNKYLEFYPKVRSGMTGLYQIMGRGNLTLKETLRVETFYLENASWVFDLSILLGTPLAVTSGLGAF
jgi:exopolysaccharide production protein ExoY